jgi:DNA-directed RNA polymerase
MGFTFANKDQQIQQQIEQQRREDRKTMSPISPTEKTDDESLDNYRTKQEIQHSASKAIFEALIAEGRETTLSTSIANHQVSTTENNDENTQKQYEQLLALDQVIVDILKPSRGKPHHLKRLMKSLATHEFEREAQRKEKLTKLNKEDKQQNIEKREIDIARSILAVLVHSMVHEIVSQYGTTYDNNKQLSAQKLLNRITPSVQIEILVRFGYAGTSQKTARQNSKRLDHHIEDLPDLDDFFTQFGFTEAEFNVTLKSMIEAVALLSGLFESSDHHSFKPSYKLIDILNDDNLKKKLMPIHPEMPMIVPPCDWSHQRRGGRYNNRKGIEKLFVQNDFLRNWKKMIKKFDMPIVYKAINALQQTSWQINESVLNVAKAVYDAKPAKLPQRLQKIHDQAYGYHLKRTNKAHIMMKRRLGMDETNRFAYQVLLEDLEKQPAFWYPWSMDARGRLYPQAPWLNIQGDDFSRGILQFADKKAVTNDEAKSYLAVHGSQFVQKDIMKKDLGLDDSLNLTADERYQWIQLHRDDIIASAKDPLGYEWWTEVADAELWQFLSFCIAWRDVLDGKPIALPVMMDGSCNGLQHMAALTRSPLIGKQTNLINNQRPEDIYTYIKAAVNAYLVSPDHPDHSNHRSFIKNWIMNQPSFMGRNIAKQVVIGFSYGSQKYKDKILKALMQLDTFKNLKTSEEIDADFVGFANQLFTWEADGKERISGSLTFDPHKKKGKHQKEKTQDTEIDDDSDDDGAEERDGNQETIIIPNYRFNIRPNLANAIAWLNEHQVTTTERSIEEKEIVERHRQVLSAWLMDRLASYLAEQFETVMEKELEDAVNLMKWLAECSDQFSPLPTCWLSPAGFPVLQPKFDKDPAAKPIESQLYGVIFYALPKHLKTETESISITRVRSNNLLQTANSRGQKIAIPPNFIHSLDASHLMMTVSAALNEGIDQFAMVHDSFGTHAEDAPKLASILRESFIELHATPQLKVMKDWSEQVNTLLNKSETELDTLTDNSAKRAMLNQLKQRIDNLSEEEKGKIKNKPLSDEPFTEKRAEFDLTKVRNARYFFS